MLLAPLSSRSITLRWCVRLLLFLLPTPFFGQAKSCSTFRTGVFAIDDKGLGPTLEITRTEKRQVERSGDVELVLRVVWLNDCIYTLEPIRMRKAGRKAEVDRSLVVKVEILETSKDHYVQRSSSGMSDITFESRVRRVR